MASVAGVAGSTALSRAALPVAAATMLVLLIFQVMGLRTSELRLSRGPYALLDHAGAAPDTRAATAQLGELIRRLQNGGSSSCSCTRTLEPNYPMGGLGNQFHNLASNMIAAIETDRMLILPRQITYNFYKHTAKLVNKAEKSEYAVHDEQCVSERDTSLNCFFEPFARCRPEQVGACGKAEAAAVHKRRAAKTGVECEKCVMEDQDEGGMWYTILWGGTLHTRLLTTRAWMAAYTSAHKKRPTDSKPENGTEEDEQMLESMTAHLEKRQGAIVYPEHVPLVHRLQRYVQYSDLWLYSQLVGHLWKLKPRVVQAVAAHPVMKQLAGRSYLAYHIRLTDNKVTLGRRHGLSMERVYNFSRYMDMATALRRANPELRTVYIAADEFDFEEATIPYKQRGWTFIMKPHSPRPDDRGSYAKLLEHNKKEHADAPESVRVGWEYFLKSPDAMGTILDLEVMKRADILIGSMTSNYFTLGVELNYFHHQDWRKRWYDVDRTAWVLHTG